MCHRRERPWLPVELADDADQPVPVVGVGDAGPVQEPLPGEDVVEWGAGVDPGGGRGDVEWRGQAESAGLAERGLRGGECAGEGEADVGDQLTGGGWGCGDEGHRATAGRNGVPTGSPTSSATVTSPYRPRMRWRPGPNRGTVGASRAQVVVGAGAATRFL